MIGIGIDEDGYVCDWSSGAEVMSGFSLDEVLGRHFVNDLIAEQHQEAVAKEISRARVGHVMTYIQLPFYTKGGERQELSLTPVLGKNGRKEAHKVTLTGSIKTSNASKSVHVDKDGLITYWGEEVCASMELRPDEVMGLSLVNDIITPNLRDLIIRKLDEALAGDDVSEFNLSIFSKSSMKKLFKIGVDKHCPNGALEGVIFIFSEHDTTGDLCEETYSKCEQPKTMDTLLAFDMELGTPSNKVPLLAPWMD
mmetsp:Transcript_113343/g.315544  ORF Transcript_113343/g.315544 Transcript_113343/m.315544 type:complete len:253 (-) Transcript_113343:81-839(-)